MNQPSVAEAVKQICDEKGIAFEVVIDTIKAALAAAYRKDFGEKNQNLKAEFDIDTGKTTMFDVKTVVEDMPETAEIIDDSEPMKSRSLTSAPEATPEIAGEEVHRFNPRTEIQIKDAQAIDPKYQIGDVITTELTIPGEFGRMAAQTAKQVIAQKLRETERESLYQEFKSKEGQIITGTVQRREGPMVLVDFGRLTAILPPEEQIQTEKYAPGSQVKVYVISVTSTTKGPEIVVSRSHPKIVETLFHLEIPEIASGVVQIKGIAREAGSRSKVAVWTDQENIDPIGSCIGQRGARIQTIISELKGEKVDIIKYSQDAIEFIGQALSPAKIASMDLDQNSMTATVTVPEDQLSLAIGRAGQNVRLAAKLTGWKINIVSNASTPVATSDTAEEVKAEGDEAVTPDAA